MSIKQKSNDKYLVDIRDEYGKRIERTFNSKSDAKAFEASIFRQKYDSKLIKNKLKDPRYLINQALLDFELTKSELRPMSVKRYRFVIFQIKSFINALGITYVDEFTTDHATLFYSELLKEKIDPKGSTDRVLKANPKTINFYISTAKAFFNQEYVKGHIRKSPMLHIKNLRVEKKKPDYYSVDELKSFFDQSMPDAFRDAFMGLLFTGMRYAELANLTWEDVDFHRQLIYIRSKADFKTKTTNGERAIPMNVVVNELLRKIFYSKRSDKYVFVGTQGLKLRERRMLDTCKKIAADAKIESRAFLHKFRHTYATMLIHQGVSIQNIKELLGHWSVVETEVYAHNKSDHLHPDVSKLNNLLN